MRSGAAAIFALHHVITIVGRRTEEVCALIPVLILFALSLGLIHLNGVEDDH